MYPVLLKLEKRRIVIVGGGRVALRKIKYLTNQQAQIEVVAPTCLPAIQKMADVTYRCSEYRAEYIAQAHLIFVCTSDNQVNQQVVADAADWQWVNDCTCQQRSQFFNMAQLISKDWLIAISSYGQSPCKTKHLKEKLKLLLGVEERH